MTSRKSRVRLGPPPPPPPVQSPPLPSPPLPQTPIPPPPPTPSPSPPLPQLPIPRHHWKKLKMCDFCHLMKARHDPRSNRYMYCQDCGEPACVNCGERGTPRAREVIDNEMAQMYMAGVFETMVADLEKSKSMSGLLTFNSLRNYIDQYQPYLSYVEYRELHVILSDYEIMWARHIAEVLNDDQYSFGVSRPVVLNTPQNWGEAIHILFRILTMANTGITVAISRALGDQKVKNKKNYCRKQTPAGCVTPCHLSGKMKKCEYNKLKDPELINDLCRAKVLSKAI